MKTVWKWIIGIVIALVVVGAIVGVIFLVHTHPLMAFGPRFGNRFNPPNAQNLPNAPSNPSAPKGQTTPSNPNIPYGMRPGWYGPGPRGYGWMWRGPMGGSRSWRSPMFGHRGFGFFPFFPFFGGFFLLGGVIIFGLCLYGAYWLGRRSARAATDPKPAAPTPTSGRRVARK